MRTVQDASLKVMVVVADDIAFFGRHAYTQTDVT